MMLVPRKRDFDLFDDMFDDPFFTRNDNKMMKTDIREHNGYYFLDIDLPGFAKENVRAELKDGYLTISADRSDTPEEQQAKGKYLRRERFVGTCKRSFFVGEDIRQEDIRATFKDGVLILAVPKEAPKKEEEKPVYITIE